MKTITIITAIITAAAIASTAWAYPPPAAWAPGECTKVATETGPLGTGRVEYWQCGTSYVACTATGCGPATG
jgi:hypothetical protein